MNCALDVVLIGAGSLGVLLLDCLDGDERWRCTALHDDKRAGQTLRGLPVLGTEPDDLPGGTRAIAAIGDPGMRRMVVERLAGRGLDWQTFLDRRSMVGREAMIGAGTLVLPFAMVSSDVALGPFCMVNAFSRVGDGSRVGAYSSLMTGCAIGDSTLGEECLVGLDGACLAGAVLEDRVTVAPKTLVRRHVSAGSLVVGNPARVFRGKARRSISAGPA